MVGLLLELNMVLRSGRFKRVLFGVRIFHTDIRLNDMGLEHKLIRSGVC
jgi:hypothetical protein